jgi:hypothetical protein
MANQAFALSPISARATLPSEEDYDAIREAFMETARGRWFLDEYAKRNRNADTRMVLDAVARIEETIAAQKQPPPPIVVDRLPAALSSIRDAVEKAQEAASDVFDGLRLAENLVPIRKGARIIKEISWRWREIGADGRICDLIDSQVAAIEASCAHLDETDPRVALRDAFEMIRTEIEAFRDIDLRAPTARAEAAVPHAAPVAARDAADAQPPLASAIHDIAEAAASAQTLASAEESDEIEAAISESEMPFESATEAVAAALSLEEADAQDEAVLDMVAMEMAAPDPDEEHDLPIVADSEPRHVTRPPVVEPLCVVAQEVAREPEPEPVLPPVEPPASALQPIFSASPSVAPEGELSLGSSLIARGIVQKSNIPANDPLAPIRRMSQAEKIAFFS